MTTGLTYTVKSREVANGQYRPRAESECCGCKAPLHIPMTNMHNNPEAVAKLAEREGWEFDSFRAGRNFCPACIKARAERRRGDSHKKETNVVQLAPAPAETRQPTNEERASIRRALDTHFDDAKGFYLDGYSDQRIGTDLRIPWSMVRTIREAAYGSLKGDPELDAVRTEVSALNARVAEAKKQADSIAADTAALLKRVLDIAKRIGVAA